MNSQSNEVRIPAPGDPLVRAHGLMVAALDIIDEARISGAIGAYLNQSIELLRDCMVGPLPPLKAVTI